MKREQCYLGGRTMQGMAKFLRDDQSIGGVITYIQTLK